MIKNFVFWNCKNFSPYNQRFLRFLFRMFAEKHSICLFAFLHFKKYLVCFISNSSFQLLKRNCSFTLQLSLFLLTVFETYSLMPLCDFIKVCDETFPYNKDPDGTCHWIFLYDGTSILYRPKEKIETEQKKIYDDKHLLSSKLTSWHIKESSYNSVVISSSDIGIFKILITWKKISASINNAVCWSKITNL